MLEIVENPDDSKDFGVASNVAEWYEYLRQVNRSRIEVASSDDLTLDDFIQAHKVMIISREIDFAGCDYVRRVSIGQALSPAIRVDGQVIEIVAHYVQDLERFVYKLEREGTKFYLYYVEWQPSLPRYHSDGVISVVSGSWIVRMGVVEKQKVCD